MDILWNCFYFLGNELIHYTNITYSEPSVIKDRRLFFSYGRSRPVTLFFLQILLC